MIEISIVVPVRNESENIKPFLQITESVLKKMEKSYEIIFVLDPSTDDTENIILEEIKILNCLPYQEGLGSLLLQWQEYLIAKVRIV